MKFATMNYIIGKLRNKNCQINNQKIIFKKLENTSNHLMTVI